MGGTGSLVRTRRAERGPWLCTATEEVEVVSVNLPWPEALPWVPLSPRAAPFGQCCRPLKHPRTGRLGHGMCAPARQGEPTGSPLKSLKLAQPALGGGALDPRWKTPQGRRSPRKDTRHVPRFKGSLAAPLTGVQGAPPTGGLKARSPREDGRPGQAARSPAAVVMSAFLGRSAGRSPGTSRHLPYGLGGVLWGRRPTPTSSFGDADNPVLS